MAHARVFSDWQGFESLEDALESFYESELHDVVDSQEPEQADSENPSSSKDVVVDRSCDIVVPPAVVSDDEKAADKPTSSKPHNLRRARSSASIDTACEPEHKRSKPTSKPTAKKA
jgi:hypothetical protein